VPGGKGGQPPGLAPSRVAAGAGPAVQHSLPPARPAEAESDLAGLDVLRSAIAVLPSGAQVIHLKLAALDFIDVCATRELVALAGRPSRPWVIFHHPPRVLARLTLDLGQAAPDAMWLPGSAGLVQALGANRAAPAHHLGAGYVEL